MRIIIAGLFFLSLISNSQADELNKNLYEISRIAMDKKPLSDRAAALSTKIKSMVNYDKFFRVIAGKDFWNSLNDSEKQEVVDANHKNYMNMYLGSILSCNSVDFRENGGSERTARSFRFECNGQRQQMDIAFSGGSVIDVSVNGSSLLANERMRLANFSKTEEIKNALLEAR